ncbi:MAG: septum formation protein Maf [Halobacteriovorax sp.]|nr:septum formation protein Maf [Halobacteriovorax sp.]|tara:strand:- start:209 stop:787 length:579 start_codon:yes stop_codon:yes gene_type:complete
MTELILASTSRYRKELLARLELPFKCVAPGVDEQVLKEKGLAPKELASQLALLKAQAVAKKHPNAIIIGSDQVAAIDELVLDKPGDEATAFKQLSLMRGREHYLFTAVALVTPAKEIQFIDTTTLNMKNLTDEQIKRYLDRDEPFDCAGSYKIETSGISLFESVTSEDFTAITGLPLIILSKHLQNLGYDLP